MLTSTNRRARCAICLVGAAVTVASIVIGADQIAWIGLVLMTAPAIRPLKRQPWNLDERTWPNRHRQLTPPREGEK